MKLRIYLTAACFFTVTSGLLWAQITSEEIVRNMAESQKEQLKNVKDVTIISDIYEDETESEVTGTEIEYRKKYTVEGKTVYKRRQEMNGGEHITIYDGAYEWEWHGGGEVTKKSVESDPSMLISDEMIDEIEAELLDTEDVDGERTYVLKIKNMLDFMALSPEEKGMLAEIKAKCWVDADEWVMRKMDMEMISPRGSMHTVVHIQEYHNEHGMLVPYKEISKSTSGMSPEMMKMQLQRVPEEHRKQAEAQMKAQMGRERIRISRVKEVKINTGLSDDLFDGGELGQ